MEMEMEMEMEMGSLLLAEQHIHYIQTLDTVKHSTLISEGKER
jgi:hypothetical protein